MENNKPYADVEFWGKQILKAAHSLHYNNTDDPAVLHKSLEIQAALNLLFDELLRVKNSYGELFCDLMNQLKSEKVQSNILRQEVEDLRKQIYLDQQIIEILRNEANNSQFL